MEQIIISDDEEATVRSLQMEEDEALARSLQVEADPDKNASPESGQVFTFPFRPSGSV